MAETDDLAQEKSQAETQRAMDIAYTINHALACTATDFIDPYFGNITQKYLGKRFSIGCGHDHSKEPHAHQDAPCSHTHSHAHSHLKHWWMGEIAGDFGAVPVTVAAQRYFPGFMGVLRQVMEPALGGLFYLGAERATRKWAAAQGIDTTSQAYKSHVEAVYQHEVSHLPQALIWTVSSIAINLTTQRLSGNKAPIWQLAAGKAVGASISACLVVTARGLAPDAAEKWDSYTSEKLFLPATRTIAKIAGIQEDDVNNMAQKEKLLKHANWAQRSQAVKPVYTSR